MTTQPAIVATNVVVAGLLTGDESAPVARILDAILGGRFPYVVSAALLTEYRDVLMRSSLRKKHGLTPTELDQVLTEIAQHAIVLVPVAASSAPDPGDQLLWNLLAVRPDLVLVTGDKLLLQSAAMRGRICSPVQFVEHASPAGRPRRWPHIGATPCSPLP